jgi:hypothetical protein
VRSVDGPDGKRKASDCSAASVSLRNERINPDSVIYTDPAADARRSWAPRPAVTTTEGHEWRGT